MPQSSLEPGTAVCFWAFVPAGVLRRAPIERMPRALPHCGMGILKGLGIGTIMHDATRLRSNETAESHSTPFDFLRYIYDYNRLLWLETLRSA